MDESVKRLPVYKYTASDFHPKKTLFFYLFSKKNEKKF